MNEVTVRATYETRTPQDCKDTCGDPECDETVYEEETGFTDVDNPYGGWKTDEPQEEVRTVADASRLVSEFPGEVEDYVEQGQDPSQNYTTGEELRVWLHLRPVEGDETDDSVNSVFALAQWADRQRDRHLSQYNSSTGAHDKPTDDKRFPQLTLEVRLAFSTGFAWKPVVKWIDDYGGSELFVFYVENQFDPPLWLVSGDNLTDAFDNFTCECEEWVKISEPDLADYDPENLQYNDNGVPIDTESVQVVTVQGIRIKEENND